MAKTFRTNQNLINDGFRQVSGCTLSLSGNTLIGNCATFRYATNQQDRYVARSITDADYVTGLTSGIRLIGTSGQVIFRDVSGITGSTNFTYDTATSGVTVPNLCISQSPVSEVGDYFLLTWDSGTTKVGRICAVAVTGIQCAVNGLQVLGNCAALGGLLTQDTTICGVDLYSLRMMGLCGACIVTTSNNIVLDTHCNSGGVYLKSQCGTIASPVVNFNCGVGIALDYASNILKIYDNRAGANRKGIEYDNDYSAFYTPRSLVDRGYVDAVAAGLSPHPAVDAATTGDTVLSGLTSVDGVSVYSGMRILVKDQMSAQYNGIYTGSTGVWGRASDFDENSETIHGAYTFVISGNTNANTSWVLSTPSPILIDITPLTFTLFAQITDIAAGTGITVNKFFGQATISVNGPTIAGNQLSWNQLTCRLDVDNSGGTYNLSSPAAITVGGISGGTVLTGKTAFQLFEELLVPELCGVITAPSVAVTLSSTGTFEVGCVISQTVCGTFNMGCINPQYCSLSDKRSGCANAYCFIGCGMPSGFQSCVLSPAIQTNGSYILSAGTQTWCVQTRFDAGQPALSNKGNQFCAALASGCTSFGTASISGIYPYYYGKVTCATRPAVTNLLVTGGTKVLASSTGTVTVTFSSVGQWTWLAIPAISTSKTCWFVNALDNGRINNAPSDKYPDECVFSICSGQGCWTSVNYKIYMSGFAATDASAIQFRNS